MTIERVALKWQCVSMHVSLSFTCSLWIKFMWYVLKSLTNISRLKTSVKTSRRTIKGSFRIDYFHWAKIAQDNPTFVGSRRLVGHLKPCRWGVISGYLGVVNEDPKTSLIPNHGPTGWSVGQGTGRRWSSIDWVCIPAQSLLCSRGEVVNSSHINIRERVVT